MNEDGAIAHTVIVRASLARFFFLRVLTEFLLSISEVLNSRFSGWVKKARQRFD
jgi:hypothetical protein